MELEEDRAAAELRRLYAEAEKLEAEASKRAPEALKLQAETGRMQAEVHRFRHSAIADFAKLGLPVFATIIAAYTFADSLGWL